ncbi:UNVERIFIED_CONTAM: hypothetical protein Sangu_1525500 [Sesamum angustifolium]|uniref:Uncharacterized protein n=1 Tax=Sesamum angustifolium TaxID=2727405 RepID=A0AAW2MRY2_9LAMI
MEEEDLTEGAILVLENVCQLQAFLLMTELFGYCSFEFWSTHVSLTLVFLPDLLFWLFYQALADPAVPVIMDGAIDEVTLDEFKLFYGLDRELYIILVRDLCRNPSECLQIMGLWLWLERGGICNVISKILSLTPYMINGLADEALTCLSLINNQFPLSSEAADIPLTHSLVKIDISLQYFLENRHTVFHEVQSLVSDVYIPALSDIMEIARHGGFGESSSQNQVHTPIPASDLSASQMPSTANQTTATPPSANQTTAAPSSASQMTATPSAANQMTVKPSSANLTRSLSSLVDSLVRSLSNLSIEGETRPRGNENPKYARTMFATFSKGYPVTETEVRQFFTRMFGNCIESFHMQEVGPDEQPLYARIVFHRPSFIQVILNGDTKAKFTINGKHVWMRQFIPRNGRGLPCGCTGVGPSTCPHHH